MSILPVFDSLCREAGVGGRGVTHPSTAPVLGSFSKKPLGLNERAVAFAATVMDFIKTEKVRSVVLAAFWGAYCDDAGFADALLATVDALRAINVTVYFMIDVPVYPYDVPKALGLYSGQGRDLRSLALPLRDYEARNHFQTDLLPKLRDRRVVVLDPVPVLQARSGSTELLPYDSGGSFYADHSHLSTYGSMALRPLFAPVVTSASRAAPVGSGGLLTRKFVGN
jgi:SGNH domain (fused to AT3 domains)